MNKIKVIIYFSIISFLFSQKILIPMDQTQSDHIKAYGIAFWSLENNQEVDWLLNYKGGSFLLRNNKLEKYLDSVHEFTDENIGGVTSSLLDPNYLSEKSTYRKFILYVLENYLYAETFKRIIIEKIS